MAEQFIILDDGETLIIGEWSPPPEVLQAKLVGLANKMENTLGPMLEARQVAIESTALHFETQSDPYGTPWESLDAVYEKAKTRAGYPEDILIRTGEGEKAATSESSYYVTEDSIWFIPANMPRYMDYHQSGTRPAALGSALEKIRTSMNEPSFTRAEAKALKTRTGRGKNLPKREFIGLNAFDIELIEGIFNAWFASNIIEEFPTGGGLGSGMGTGFNMLGEFPIIGYTSKGQPMLRTPKGVRFGRK